MEQTVTLAEMLDAREARAMRQRKLLAAYGKTLLCFTMNIAGPVKNSARIREGFLVGSHALRGRLRAAKIPVLYAEEIDGVTGCEAFYVLDADPMRVKEVSSALEDAFALGRLFDMDVIRPNGVKVDRTELGLGVRRCLLCGKPSKVCARSRSHTVADLQERTGRILAEAVPSWKRRKAAELACRALLYEVATTPKPGLVDRNNNGSHQDMDIFTFIDSSCALHDYFETCTGIGMETAGDAAPETFRRLRTAGVQAEADMLAATGGVNTHKGAIFSIGIVCGALGRLSLDDWAVPEKILAVCAAMTAGIVELDFAGLTEETAVTAGQKLYLRCGITGIRGQMEAGLPAVLKAGLPVLKAGLAAGLDINDAGCAALLSLMTAATDTNLIARSDLKMQQETVDSIRRLLSETPFPDREALLALDRRFIEKNLSPGGSADLLAITYLLYFLEPGGGSA